MSPRQASIVREEFDRRRAGKYAGIGDSVSLALYRHGTEWQKSRFLQGMAAGEIMWGEGYTEPDAGSDLASLRTRAVKDGDDWVISGQKTFCTAGHHCNWIIIAARTDPDVTKRHRGISYFLSPMDRPEIELRPLYNLGGGRQNQVFLNDVRVTPDLVLGDINEGWRQVWFRLGGNPLPYFRDEDPGPDTEYEPVESGDAWILSQLIDYCRVTTRHGRTLSEDPVIREKLADLAIGVEINKMLEYEVPCEYGVHMHPAITKEFRPQFAQTCFEIIGALAQIQSGSWAPLAGEIDRAYRQSFSNHSGGTSQIKRMTLATRVLGLPR